MIILYARQSVDKKDSLSIESQFEYCRQMVGAAAEKVVELKDPGFSGKNVNRPDFQKALALIEEGRVSQLIVYKLDRMSRSLCDFVDLMEIFKKHGVEFLSVSEKFDTSTPMGNAMLSILMVFAQFERETTALRVRDNYRSRAKRGMYLGGPPAYGFEKEPVRLDAHTSTSRLVPKESMSVVEMIYHSYAGTEVSLGSICKMLNEKEIPAPNGGLWDSGKISRILHNPAYVKADADVYAYFKARGCQITNEPDDFLREKGCLLFGKRESNERKYTDVTDHVLSLGLHEGVIDSRTWLECQEKLNRNKQLKNTGQGKYTWLSGLVKCGKCGYSMKVAKSKSSLYFVCSGRTNYSACAGHSIAEHVKDIEACVERELKLYFDEMKRSPVPVQETETTETNVIKIKLLKVENEIQTLADNLAQCTGATVSILNEKINGLSRERESLLRQLEEQMAGMRSQAAFEEVIGELDHWETMDLEAKKSIARCLIKTVFIRDTEISIQWRR